MSAAPTKEISSMFEGVDLVGTVSTLYKDPTDARFEIALDTAEAYQRTGLPLVVIDSSGVDAPWVKAAFEQREAIVLEASISGIATQRQQGVGFAFQGGAKKVVGHEPEKNLMATFATEITDALDTSDLLVIGRTQEAETSLPPVQQRTERLAGWILEQTLLIPPDSLSGARGFSAPGADCLEAYPALEEGMNSWLYLYLTVLEARARGDRVGGLLVNLTHPQIMVNQETRSPIFDAKRYMQFNMQLRYLLNRPEVRPEAQPLADYVLEGLKSLPIQATPDDNAAYEAYLGDLENHVLGLGYSPVSV